MDQRKLRILMLEDNQDDAELILHLLRKDNLSFQSQCVDTRDEFEKAIGEFQPDVILSDHGLPSFNSREALKIASVKCPTSPFILVTGAVSDEYAVSCLHEGADDYVLKSNLLRLPAAIRGAIRKRKLERLKRDARHALRKQNEELRKVNRELDNFVYSVSHNLRGPLASLMGLLSLAKDEVDQQRVSQIYNLMGVSMTKLDETLREIVDYSRNARTEIHLSLVDWNALLDHCFARCEHHERGKQITKEITLHCDEPFGTDASRLTTILTNIFSNSIVFSNPAETSRIHVEVITTELEVQLTIEDNGVGISDFAKPKIFDMFYRGSEKSKGSGLGLYVVKEVVDRLRGEISVESTVGIGTTVTVTLPNEHNKLEF